MGRILRFANERPFSAPLIFVALQIVVISALFSFYNVDLPSVRPALNWIKQRLNNITFVRNSIQKIQNFVSPYFKSGGKTKSDPGNIKIEISQKEKEKLPIFTSEQLALFDGSRESKPVYLAILGRVYNVDKGRKHYGQGGGYHFFAGKDATKAFVTGDFTSEGLSANVIELSENELLSINDWIAFYENEYKFVGFLSGIYYDAKGQPTELLVEVQSRIEDAKLLKKQQNSESEVFPPCNSEWKKDTGGRVWCTGKSGGIIRDWVGVPRKLFNPNTRQHRCVCVKNYGPSLSTPNSQTNRGDLDNPNLQEYPDCSPSANSCKIPA